MRSCRSGLARMMVGVVLTAASTVAFAGDATVPGEVTTPYPTIINLSIVWEIQGDDDLDGIVTVQYRASGEAAWHDGLPLFRVPAGVTQYPAVAGYTWSNKHAGSIFDLEPDTQYEITLSLTDPDGGSTQRTVTATTRPVPSVSPSAPVTACTPATFSAVLGAASPGDIVLCGAGSYGGVIIGKDGAAGLPLVIRGEAGASFTSVNMGNRKYVYLESVTVTGNGCINLIGAENCVVRRCTVNLTGSSYGIGADRPPGARNCYISDNTVIGPNTWSVATMYPDCVGEGIEMTGPGNVICYNSVRGCRDNISTMEGSHASEQISIDIYNNDLTAGCDDAIEADYCMNNCRIMRNRITNCFVALSAQPTMGGPTYFIRNVMYNLSSTSFKFHCYTMGDVVLHNTAVKSGGGMNCFAGEAFDYAYFRNNLCIGGPSDPAVVAKHSWAAWGSGSPVWIGAAGPHCSFDYDALGTVSATYEGQIGTQTYTSFAELISGPHETHAIQAIMSVFDAVLFPYSSVPELPHPDLRPVSGSAVVDNALLLNNVNDGFLGAGPDRGAYEAGQPLPHYGPRPEDFFIAEPTQIPLGGISVLTWQVTGGTNVRLDGEAVPASGSRQVAPSATTTYTLTADTPGGAYSEQVTVTVGSAPVLTSIVVSPDEVNVVTGGTQAFAARALDQYGDPMAAAVSWNVSGGGTLAPASGNVTVFTSDGTEDAFTITAFSGGVDGTANFTVSPVLMKVNCGPDTPAVAGWETDNAYVSGGSDFTFSAAADVTGVANAAPVDVYKTCRHMDHSYSLPSVPDGGYTVRLHFYDEYAADGRAMDYTIEGQKVLDGFSIIQEVGTGKALVKEFPVSVSGDDGLQIVAAKDTGNDAFDCGIEILTTGGTPPSDTEDPTVEVTSPQNAATVGGLIVVCGTVADNRGVVCVEVGLDGGAFVTALGTVSWSYAINTTQLTDGAHTITARATDTSGNTAEASVTVTVDNAAAGDPTATITAPLDGAKVSGTVTVEGTASDDGTVSLVEVQVDSAAYEAAAGTTSWTYALDTTALADGSHTITVRVTDDEGNTATASVIVTVDDAAGPASSRSTGACGAAGGAAGLALALAAALFLRGRAASRPGSSG